MKLILALVIAAAGLSVGLGYLLKSGAPEIRQAVSPLQDIDGEKVPAPARESASLPSGVGLATDAEPAPENPTAEDWQPDPQMINSLRASLDTGDPRAPAIGESLPRATPEPSVLDRPDLYEDFEASQEKKLYRAYVAAALEKEAWLEQEIENARGTGLSDAQLREGTEKLRRIREMRAALEAETAP